ncbi:MAG: biopolymer transport protein ExbD [Pseudomonadota bacterium]|jgi:biopolymer transport protein ExbD|nr:biopolymer transport protein ExbD [Pseudomonadota bacterium]MDQ5902861.1 biopolymer transport protein ExbD [Pseudomonadota bacterium]MDQ5907530.1 biopolymer transport protein ExbD [Pseudomonadota bacterium]MDQ5942736.1 biopolymer transport protein ExbD [Pseudomonadota bacterium]
MAFASLDSSDDDAPLAEINMVPLIDVMLVLLIIFMVTAPLLTHAVKVDLPKASSSANLTKPDNVQLAIDAGNQIFWNGEPVDTAQLGDRLKAAGAQQPQPELHIRAERTATYEKVAQVMSEAARNGLTRIGFITDPSPATRQQ